MIAPYPIISKIVKLNYMLNLTLCEIWEEGTPCFYVDEKIKVQAIETLAEIGLSVSDPLRVFLMRVVAEKQMPFALKVTKVETRDAIAEANQIALTRRAGFGTSTKLFDDLEKKLQQVSALYCRKTQTIQSRFWKIGSTYRGLASTTWTGSRLTMYVSRNWTDTDHRQRAI